MEVFVSTAPMQCVASEMTQFMAPVCLGEGVTCRTCAKAVGAPWCVRACASQGDNCKPILPCVQRQAEAQVWRRAVRAVQSILGRVKVQRIKA